MECTIWLNIKDTVRDYFSVSYLFNKVVGSRYAYFRSLIERHMGECYNVWSMMTKFFFWKTHSKHLIQQNHHKLSLGTLYEDYLSSEILYNYLT